MEPCPIFPHTAMIVGSTGCGKSYFVMKLLTEGFYKDFYDVVIIICPTFKDNDTYQSHLVLFGGASTKPEAHATAFYYFDFPPEGLYCVNWRKYGRRPVNLQEAIKGLSAQFANYGEVLFIVDDMAADKQIVKRKSALSELAISGRHTNRSLWVLTQKYNEICKMVRAQTMWLVSFYTKDYESFKAMMLENDVGLEKKI